MIIEESRQKAGLLFYFTFAETLQPLFNLFNKKEKHIPVTDIVWVSQDAKWNGIIDCWKKNNSIAIICWFDATLQHLESLEGWNAGSVSILKADKVWASHIAGKEVIFAEHYPLQKKEQALFRQLSLPKVIIYSSLDEALFTQFGGEKIIQLMKTLGMKEDESFEHAMISNSISNAQQKIEKKVTSELLSSSQEDWFQKNFIS